MKNSVVMLLAAAFLANGRVVIAGENGKDRQDSRAAFDAAAQLLEMAKVGGVADVIVPPEPTASATEDKAKDASDGSIEKIMQESGSVVIDNPLFGGLPFLAVSGSERAENSYAPAQQKRATNLCKMLGYAKPTLAAVRWIYDAGSAISVDDEENGTVSQLSPYQKTKEVWEDAWSSDYGGVTERYPGKYYTVNVGDPFPWAVFSKIVCKK